MASVGLLDAINNSKIAWGLSTVVMQLGARYVVGDLTEMQNKVLASKLVKRLVLCGMIFVVTHDIMLAIGLTAAIHFVLTFLFNEKSRLCILPFSLFFRGDSSSTAISREQYAQALLVVQGYHDQVRHLAPAEPRQQGGPPRIMGFF